MAVNYQIDYLKQLEYESIYIIREALSQFTKTALLFSGGKDSITVLHLLRKAFWPAKVNIPLLHIDTGHNFPETIEFRDRIVEKLGLTLIVKKVQDTINAGKAREEKGLNPSRNAIQSITLLDAIQELDLDACFGGARRDEEKSRAKERFFSHRDEFGQWDPKNQRPELWNLLNGRKNKGENFRIFPLSNWTELDVWNYIKSENIEVPSLYYAHERNVFNMNGVLYAVGEFMQPTANCLVENKKVRFRTIGDMSCTGAVLSEADNNDRVIEEIASSTITERGTRVDDQKSDASMEERKKQGYF
ncbi:MAG: sulfate adenylyltransferase subunit CysD [Candidatus Caenarcaniphilales bacterium]|nr:sulfate adenylyltransferase subunit CysD [Candidatus Caenarcaniphilales bacterium]